MSAQSLISVAHYTGCNVKIQSNARWLLRPTRTTDFDPFQFLGVDYRIARPKQI
jgi:hypothetical protein